jgi:hypothetical protein
VNAQWAKRVAEGVFRAGRLAKRAVPPGVRKQLDDRLFYVIFQLTRVQNDDLVSDTVRKRRADRAQSPVSGPDAPT